MLASPNFSGENRGGKGSQNGLPRLSIKELSYAWTLTACAEAKSENTIRIMLSALGYFEDYLNSIDVLDEAETITPILLRSYIVYLQHKPALDCHPLTHVQPHLLSDQTVHGYCRALRAFFNWLAAEGFIEASPFDHLKLPHLKQRIIKPYSSDELKALLGAVNTASHEGYRDLCLLLVLIDTAARSGEVTGILMADVDLEGNCIKVLGKSNREHMLPIGSEVKRHLWRYVKLYRAQPASPREDYLFLTSSGRRLTRNRLLAIVSRYSRLAGIQGVRCSPHTLRHSAALAFLQNGGDAFALQKLLGHTSLEMTRRYCQLADGDLKKMHRSASPADNLHLKHHGMRQARTRPLT